MTVLVLTRDSDATGDLVIAQLNDRGVPVHRLDPGDFPEAVRLSARLCEGPARWEGVLHGRHRDLSLADVRSVYYRRPSHFRLHPGLTKQEAKWAEGEARAGMAGLLASLDCTWVNHPHRNAAAEVKPRTLAAAVRCGLRVPRTLITNEPEQARAFVESLPGRVAAYKALGPGGTTERQGIDCALWTNRVRAEQITGGVARTAHQFQEWIDKAYEVRLTIVAGQVFAAEIHAGSEASRIDFRTDYDSLTYKVCPVPDRIAQGVRELADTFKLHYAALDFLVDGDGEWFLVDVNPNGQFGFVPDLQEPVARALADLLEGRSR
ncbi:ATP-grasp ribosomal peptide maturase [Streptomyces sp. NPDC059506]|uniref:ATP-grasp ribosomal peptide maturase n=1 Tax=Streptomyces sp. NPDC059506 TaxID=3347751 RepID=UPI0036A89271